jgi:hypothetical protein
MYYAQLHRPGKGVYKDLQDDDIEEFVYWAGFNEDPSVLLNWVRVVNRPGDRIQVWTGKLFDDLSFEQDDDNPCFSFEVAPVN